VVVNQTLTGIAVTPNVASVYQGSDLKFTAQAFDQFRKAMTTQPPFAWTANGGKISATGVFTAPSNVAGFTVTAKSGSVAGTATVSVVAASGWKNAALGKLVQSLDADGSISRQT